MKISSKWPYWVKGGVTTALVVGVWYSFAKWAYATEWFCPLNWADFCTRLDAPLYYLIPSPIKILFTIYNWGSDGNFAYAILVQLMMYYFLIGCSIGLIYGKIKNRKRKLLTPNH